MDPIDIGQKCKKLVQYIWDPEPRNDSTDSPLWCLGNKYTVSQPPATASEATPSKGKTEPSSGLTAHNVASSPQSAGQTNNAPNPEPEPSGSDDDKSVNAGSELSTPGREWPVPFLDDFESKFWLTYRSNFPPIPMTDDDNNGSSSRTLAVRLRMQLTNADGFTTDTGWGCMIRSGQSLLANALSFLSLGRDWRRGTLIDKESKLLSLFADDPRAPFSIHRFVEHGASSCGKHPGEWFGPSAAARCIEALSGECRQAGLNVYVTNDGSDVYEDRFRQIATSGSGGTETIQPTLILLGVRLGIDRVTPVYREALKCILKYPQSVGIAGGRPSSSHYFVGVQGDYFFYLDPHHTRRAVPYDAWAPTLGSDELNTYHTRRLRRLHIQEMDPSMLIGFLIRNEDDWRDWKERVRQGPGKPIIHIFDGPSLSDRFHEREGALDEVETLDDE